MAPVITVTFDNNAAKNGLYFNAPRTATVSILERNFSPDLASVAAQAKEDCPRPVKLGGGGRIRLAVLRGLFFRRTLFHHDKLYRSGRKYRT